MGDMGNAEQSSLQMNNYQNLLTFKLSLEQECSVFRHGSGCGGTLCVWWSVGVNEVWRKMWCMCGKSKMNMRVKM